MSPPLLPLFPLSLVLLPGMPLPLHIFEDRYKEMMADLIPAGREFGVVLAKNEGIVNVGCTALVRNVFRRYEDGRLDIMVSGQRRFLIGSVDQDLSYLRAEVEYFDDENEPAVDPALRMRALSAFASLLPAAEEGQAMAFDATSAGLSFRLAELMDDLDKRQTVLGMRSERGRLEYLLQAVPDYLLRQEQTGLARRVAPLNGHAKHVTTH